MEEEALKGIILEQLNRGKRLTSLLQMQKAAIMVMQFLPEGSCDYRYARSFQMSWVIEHKKIMINFLSRLDSAACCRHT